MSLSFKLFTMAKANRVGERVKLERLYNTLGHALAFGTLPTITSNRGVSLPKHDIKDFLASTNTYTLHRDVRRPRQYNPTYAYRPNELVQLDLATFQDMGENNAGYKYILVGLDCFSRKMYCQLLKNKTARSVLEAFKKMRLLDMDSAPISRIVTDAGAEFKNSAFKKYCSENKIEFHLAKVSKPALVERAIRSLKSLIGKYATKYGTSEFYTALPAIVTTYNNRKHRMLTFAPNHVHQNRAAQDEVRKINEIRWAKIKRRKPKFQVGNVVRIAKLQGRFGRHYQTQHVRELFKVVQVNRKMPIPSYVISTLDGQEVLDGPFNPGELTRVKLRQGEHIRDIIERKDPYVKVAVKDPLDPDHQAWVHKRELYNVNGNGNASGEQTFTDWSR